MILVLPGVRGIEKKRRVRRGGGRRGKRRGQGGETLVHGDVNREHPFGRHAVVRAHPGLDVVGNALQAVGHLQDILERLFADGVVARAQAPGKVAVEHVHDRADRAHSRQRKIHGAERAVEHLRAEPPEQVHRRRDGQPLARGVLVAGGQGSVAAAGVGAHANDLVADPGELVAHLGVGARAGQVEESQRDTLLPPQPEQGLKKEGFDAAVLAAGTQVAQVHGHADRGG